MTVSETAALVAVLLSVGTNVALYVHLSTVMNNRFDAMDRKADAKFESVERRLEMILGSLHEMDVRLTKLEARSS